ncbi:hypothetical protein TRICHSKD4_0543 [Roseibium sp. TrichSKD4]|nr:hypothetical protein TRICHSKD4_0543 [Roseibium sp. TrichSKD4]
MLSGSEDISMQCNPDEFRHLVEQLDLSPLEQDELIRTVWRIMENAVDRAWKTDPVQMACAVRDNSVPKNAKDCRPVIELQEGEYQDLGVSKSFNQDKGA